MYLQSYQSPCGLLTLGQIHDKICMCIWSETPAGIKVMERAIKWYDMKPMMQPTNLLTTAMEQLDDYFAGTRTSFTIPILTSGTPFQMRLWQVLKDIPYGHTVSYSTIAQRLRASAPVREVARVIATNPLNIFLPCHRVIGKDQSLTGYAGGLGCLRNRVG